MDPLPDEGLSMWLLMAACLIGIATIIVLFSSLVVLLFQGLTVR